MLRWIPIRLQAHSVHAHLTTGLSVQFICQSSLLNVSNAQKWSVASYQYIVTNNFVKKYCQLIKMHLCLFELSRGNFASIRMFDFVLYAIALPPNFASHSFENTFSNQQVENIALAQTHHWSPTCISWLALFYTSFTVIDSCVASNIQLYSYRYADPLVPTPFAAAAHLDKSMLPTFNDFSGVNNHSVPQAWQPNVWAMLVASTDGSRLLVCWSAALL